MTPPLGELQLNLFEHRGKNVKFNSLSHHILNLLKLEEKVHFQKGLVVPTAY